jgi:uncharacterized protein YqeY
MTLKIRILDDVKAAMKAREPQKLSALRLLTAAIKQKEVDERIELDDGQVLSIIEKLIKQRKESAVQFDAAGRVESAAAERFEVGVLSVYQPVQMSLSEVEALIRQAIAEAGAVGLADLGKVMTLIKPRLAGRADMAAVSAQARQLLQR